MDLDFFKDIKYQSHEQFLLNLVITAIISYGIGQFYVKFGTSISNRKKYAQNFLLLSLTTMLIIYIVKASVALSLGLVGALSIIRFRTAIKEPEELGYLFLNIGIGLAMGANQVFVTLIAVTVILILLFGQALLSKKEAFSTSEHMFINILCQRSQVDPIHEILKQHFKSILLKRMDNSGNMITLSYQISTTNMDLVIQAQDALAAFSNDIEFSFIEQRNLVF
ncbi:DUF4956 domain-containing protein [Adhaeribacter terreus]|uniref:DUF4956 domain-containing protein n=1 Tax=Adhaeribacter terreus TaxID=529703 RepID=A0ABW0EA16_9BACT